jgi:hypothetical protein
MEKFKHEERFLELITESDGIMLSMTELADGHGLTPDDLIDKPKFSPYFLDGVENSINRIIYLDSIFVFYDNIYIYLSKNEPMISSFSCKIYYPIKKKKDVEFFILNLKKLKKNGN